VSAGKESGDNIQDDLDPHLGQVNTNESVTLNKDLGPGERKPARGPEPFEKWEREEMEQLLGELCGHLGITYLCPSISYTDHQITVTYPTHFLEAEDVANNFLFNADRSVVLGSVGL
jgi:phospholipase D1/2